MQTVNFQCGLCGKLMAVGTEFLGRLVRCPHCQQAVLAPAALTADAATASLPQPMLAPTPEPLPPPEPEPPPPPPAADPPAALAPELAIPTLEITPPDDGDDIFSAPPESDDLFGSSAPPRIEIPLDPPAPTAPAAMTSPAPVAPEAPAEPAVADTPFASLEAPPYLPPPIDPFIAPTAEEPIPTETAAPAWLPEPAGHGDGPTDSPRLRLERQPVAIRRGISIWYVIPLASYSLLATCLLVVLWNRLQLAETHPLIAFLPDAEGDNPGVIRKPKAVSEERKRRLSVQPLPDELRLRLGETLTVGALAITAQRVAWEQLAVAPGDTRPESLKGRSLVLHLKLQNISEDESFQPLDRYFDRRWQESKPVGPPPLTLLEAGPRRRYYGGPATWRPHRPSPREEGDPPEFVYRFEGPKPVRNPIDRPLDPGQSVELFVCTDGDDPAVAELARYRGDLLWRIHVRRGLVRVQDQDVPAAAVVGVAFTDRDIHKDG